MNNSGIHKLVTDSWKPNGIFLLLWKLWQCPVCSHEEDLFRSLLTILVLILLTVAISCNVAIWPTLCHFLIKLNTYLKIKTHMSWASRFKKIYSYNSLWCGWGLDIYMKIIWKYDFHPKPKKRNFPGDFPMQWLPSTRAWLYIATVPLLRICIRLYQIIQLR